MENYKIQANAKGSRYLTVTEQQLCTIDHYGLFRHLVDSNGIVDEQVLVKLRMNVSALMDACPADGGLIDLCANVLFHDHMKAFALQELVKLYADWLKTGTEGDNEAEEAHESEA